VIFILVASLFALIFNTYASALLTWLGFYISWIYLRFYKGTFVDLSSSQQPSLRGDASESFSFASFFPEQIQPPIASIADTIYGVVVSAKLLTPFSEADIAAGNSRAQARGEGLNTMQSRSGGAVPGSARAEAERRRALALKALDQRLSAATNKAHSAGQAAIAEGPSVLGETTYEPEPNEGATGPEA